MKKRILSLLTCIAMCLTLLPLGTQAQAAYFRDVPSSHWAKEYIDEAVDLGLFNGTGDNQFSPSAAMTRSMFVTVLYRLDGGEAESSANFTDVPRGSWYSDAVAWASENSIVTGTGGGRFSPKANVTREQLITILYRYLNAAGATLEDSGTSVTFRDSSSISSYARPAVQAMKDAGIIGGKPDSYGGYRFDPRGKATRAEVASIMCRFLESVNYDDIDDEEPDPEAAYEQMDKITQSSTLKSLSSQYETASDSQKKNLAEQAIAYFEQQEENGTIDYCDVDRDNGVISYEIDGCKFAYFLRDITADATAGSASTSTSSSQLVTGNFTTSDNASNLVGASSRSSNGKALILNYYPSSDKSSAAQDFHNANSIYEGCAKAVGYTPTTIYGYKVSDLMSGLDQYKMILFNSHGNIVSDTPVLCLSEIATFTNYTQTYKDDVKAGTIGCAFGLVNAAFSNARYYVYGSFFTRHYSRTKLNATYVHLGSCYGFSADNHLAASLSDAGAKSVVGYADTVTTGFDAFCIVSLFEYMSSGYTLKNALDPAYTAAVKNAREACEKQGIDFGQWSTPRMRLYGNGQLEFEAVETLTGKIKITVQPDAGTLTDANYRIYRIRANSTETLEGGKSFTGNSFEISGLQDGVEYRVEINAKNYDSAEVKVKAAQSPQTTIVPLTYNPPTALDPVVSTAETEITVRDLDNKALKNASVTLYGKKNGSSTFVKLTSGTTDSSGKCTIDKVDISYTTLKAEASLSGYISGSTEKSFAGQGRNKRYIDVTLDTEKSLEPDDDSALPNASSDGWTYVYNSTQLTKALEANRNIKLMADVKDVEGVTEYSGILDGNGHTVTNPQLITYKFGFGAGWIVELTNGTIKNLKIADVNFQVKDAKEYIGLIGETSGSCTIENCAILSGQISNIDSDPSVGAFVGIAINNLTMKNCVNMASVSAISNSISWSYASGMIGWYGWSETTDSSGTTKPTTTVTISHCLNLGSIYAETGSIGSAIASGISSSYNDNSNVDITITNCGNGGEISAKHRETSSYAVASALSPQYSGVSGYATQKYNNDSNKSYLSIVSRDTLLSMWSDVLN